MTLNRKLILSSTTLILGMFALGAVALWGILMLQQNLRIVVAEFGELKMVAEVEGLVAAAQERLDPELSQVPEAVVDLRRAQQVIQQFLHSRDFDAAGQAHRSDEIGIARTAQQRLDAMADSLEASMVQETPTINLALAAAVDDALLSLRVLSAHADAAVSEVNEQTRRQIVRTVTTMSVIAALILAGGVLVALWQHHSVMGPMRRLRGGVRSIAAGRFTDRLSEAGDREFAELATDFNRMASQLDELYRNLERQVEIKSRELVRSERLASVGFLAAGMAHEINNPLGIISGYAELSLKELEHREAGGEAEIDRSELVQSLQIVRDEAFRCKQIIGKLLSLARQAPEGRHDVDMAAVAQEVATMVRGLNKYRDRRLVLDFPSAGDHVSGDGAASLSVQANATEMKQVLLNLCVNALEATDPRTGRVMISGRRDDGQVRITVEDDGVGMTPQTLAHVFEPFFTERRTGSVAASPAGGASAETSGTGLGLSVTLAIVENHQGRIHAESDGPGRGSRFTVELPAAASVPASAAPARIATASATAGEVTR